MSTHSQDEQSPEATETTTDQQQTESTASADTGADPHDLSLEQALEKLQQAEEAAARAKEDLLRVQAEMQNLRRRTEQDVEKAHKYGQERFASELLSVVDNLERALAAAADHEDEVVQAIYEGVDLTLRSFNDVFTKFDIETIDPLGEPFDPQRHQAMSMVDNPDAEPNSVTAVMQKGYTLHGRVIRPAMVMVAKPSAGVSEKA